MRIDRSQHLSHLDPVVRARIYVASEESQHPLVRAAIGEEWTYAGGLHTTSTQVPPRANAGAMGLNHIQLHAEVERQQQRSDFVFSRATSGMLEIGSSAFEERYPSGAIVTRGAIGHGAVEGKPVSLLVRSGDELIEVDGRQRGSKRDGDREMLLVESGGRIREVPFFDIEVAFAQDPIVHHGREARAGGFRDVEVPPGTPEEQASFLAGLAGRSVAVVAKTREYVPYGKRDLRAYAMFEGTLEPLGGHRRGMFKLSGKETDGVEVTFSLGEIGPGQLFTK